MHFHRKRVSALALAVTALLATAAPGGAHVVAASGPEPEPGQRCSWGAGTNPDTINVAYPDLDAHYWSHRFNATPGTRAVVRGRYPEVRYFSFHVYGGNVVPVDSIYDSQIYPNKGSVNPFVQASQNGAKDRYELYVEFTDIPDEPAPNTVYAGSSSAGSPNAYGTLMLRTYVPQTEKSPQGSVPFPQVNWETKDGVVLESDAACANQDVGVGGGLNDQIKGADYPDEGVRPNFPNATNPPTWTRAGGNKAVGLYGNQQNAYLTARLSREHGDVVVIRGKAPTFPDTRAGEPAYLKTQVRYWSICENNVSTRVISCAADYRAALRNGYYTYVVSDPADRPANATKANGVTWLPWGGFFPDGTLILRNMLPAKGFHYAAENVDVDESARKEMGAYYPNAVYCDRATFERAGWRGCPGL